MFRKKLLVVVLVVVMGLYSTVVNAQSTVNAVLSEINLSEFPRISALLDIRDAEGLFVTGLLPGQVAVIENGQEFQAAELVEIRPGAQIIVAVNPGNSLAIRDHFGFTRYENLSTILQNWMAQAASDNIDDLSLVVPGEVPVHNTRDANQWVAGWQAFTPNLESSVPGMEPLNRAIELAMEQPSQPGMGRAILLVTPLFSPQLSRNLNGLGDIAAESGIRIYVFLVDSSALFTSEEAISLQNLAIRTGGQYFAYSGEQLPPDFGFWFESARRKYQLAYQSVINTAGLQQVSVRVNSPVGEVLSDPLEFEMALRPPNPVFVSIPAQILRAIPEDAEIAIENLEPKEFPLEVLFDFPDNIHREIAYTALYANNEIIAENSQPPFDRFVLDLTAFEASARVYIRVEARDELGLIGSSLDIPVQITVQRPEQGVSAVLARNAPVLTVGVAVLAGAVLFLVLVLAGRISPRRLGEWRRRRKALGDPVTQPLSQVLEEADDKSLRQTYFGRRIAPPQSPTPRVKKGPEPIAYLVPINEDGDSVTGTTISISSNEVTIGSNPGEVEITLENPAVDGLHARLWQNTHGDFFVADHGSIAGTWINYAPVSKIGCRVEHGDLLHFAKQGFRFKISQPKRTRNPVVIPQKELP